MMRVGFRIEVTDAIDFRPHTIVRRGEGGAVVAVDPASGEVTIMLDRYHKGLAEWHNTLSILPGWEGDEIRAKVRIAKLRAVDERKVDRSGEYSQVA